VLILDDPTYSFSEARVSGFIEGLHQRLPNARIVARLAGGADESASQDALATFLRGTQSIDAVFALTDSGAYGAIDALSDAGVDPDTVIVASVNAESRALDEIRSGNYLRTSVDVGREAGSMSALNAAVKLLGGGSVPETIILPSVNLITRDIMDQQTPPPASSS
jgi:ABC-type sugar transport system substrate-binding protein